MLSQKSVQIIPSNMSENKIFKDIKLENFNSIETFFWFTKFDISFIPQRGLILKE